MSMAAEPLFGVILAGGSGTRFWPLSRSQYPKQVLRLLGSDSLLQSTVARLLPRIPLERLAVVTNAAQADVIRLELHRRNWHGMNLWLEPEGRNTAPAVALAAARLGPEAGKQVMAVFPADHYIKDQTRFLEALEKGTELARAGHLVTFGITPTRPDTGYGYIQIGEALDSRRSGFQARRFIEKPDLERAKSFMAAGGYYWNSGIFLFRRDLLLEAIGKYLPELYAAVPMLQEADPEGLADIYQRLPNISLDHGIMEKADNVAVVPVDMGWSDVGTWAALYDLFPKDERGNILMGRALDLESKNSLVFSQNRLVATIGLEDAMEKHSFDGKSLWELMRGERVANYNEIFITECTWMRKHGVRTHEWKLIEALEPDFHGFPQRELYNLIKDPLENNNVAESEPEIYEALRSRMMAYIQKRVAETGRPHPIERWQLGTDLYIGGVAQAQKLQAKE